MGQNSTRNTFGVLVIGLGLSAQPLAANATPLLIKDWFGTLVGANGVDVGSATYNVRFVDGTCEAVFGACDTAHFVFQSTGAAGLAAQALLDQVLIDEFDRFPERTRGCVNSNQCQPMTPYLYDLNPINPAQPIIYYAARNFSDTAGSDDIITGDTGLGDTGAATPFASGHVWAQWELVTNPPDGTSSSPVLLFDSSPIGQVIGTIGGFGSEQYYAFTWGGGSFSATASITGANAGASYLFSEGLLSGPGFGTCGSSATVTLDDTNAFSATIAFADLSPGAYCVGVTANDPDDPVLTIAFDTPIVSAIPEPGTLVLFASGLAGLGIMRRRRKARA